MWNLGLEHQEKIKPVLKKLTYCSPILHVDWTHYLTYIVDYDYIKHSWVDECLGPHILTLTPIWHKIRHSIPTTHKTIHLSFIYVYISTIFTCSDACPRSPKFCPVLETFSCYVSNLIPLFLYPYYHTNKYGGLIGYPTPYWYRKISLVTISN